MAGPAGALTLRRSATLLRITQAREGRHRRAVAAARQACEAAAAAEVVAHERQEAFGRARARRMREAHQALHGRVVDPGALEALARLDGRLAAAAASLDDALRAAQHACVRQQGRLDAALSECRDASRTTVRRERMVVTLQRALDRAGEVREDIERDDRASERRQACAALR